MFITSKSYSILGYKVKKRADSETNKRTAVDENLLQRIL